MRSLARSVAALGALTLAAGAGASPNVPAGDDVYLELGALRAAGKLPPSTGGIGWVTEAEAARLFGKAGAEVPLRLRLPEDGFWALPVARAAAGAEAVRDHPRPYSLAIRPRALLGEVAVSCEHIEGRPCGDGHGDWLELDSAAGYGRALSAFTRLRLQEGTGGHPSGFVVDRAYLNAELGPVALEVGRDALRIGPAVRSALMWSDQTAPADHARISTSRPLALLGTDGSILRANLLYAVVRLRDPQMFHGTLVSIERAQLDVADRVELGISRTLQIGGDGAPPFGIGRFLWEQVALLQGNDNISNNRASADLAISGLIPRSRLYGEFALEDDTPRYDADYLAGLETFYPWSWLRRTVVEFHRTSSISYEHWLFQSGMENAGRVVGSALGPEAASVYARADLTLLGAQVAPWAEWAALRTDRGYYFEQPLGKAEVRYRAGADAGMWLGAGVRLESQLFVERVRDLAFVDGSRAWNGGVRVQLSWTPREGGVF